MVNIIAGAVICLILGFSIGYIYKEKKKGTHCIGCPMAGNCHKSGSCKKIE
ncbi:FeoB-associated Cys-rich membrane protein [Butyrivibrio sp. YAB3001]|uniref:FeoB-associated Cys-rich membrane protein n=1 Tax=Butyrivibrio sp. YAB3001 TaxID=1520812 RepID=UPI0008F65FE0|nr:FeoB-associated Cys-rich membrane protein [Butyrivibrio sp. YAB3001]SFC53359.1 hypothetical protein SAMN02910398_02469 [Butyrivibrio sp. YAB3001]